MATWKIFTKNGARIDSDSKKERGVLFFKTSRENRDRVRTARQSADRSLRTECSVMNGKRGHV